MRNKTLYLECFSGISGDMAVASLIDLGVEHDHLLKALDSLHLDGYKVKISVSYTHRDVYKRQAPMPTLTNALWISD